MLDEPGDSGRVKLPHPEVSINSAYIFLILYPFGTTSTSIIVTGAPDSNARS
jgi:hypothetical protein